MQVTSSRIDDTTRHTTIRGVRYVAVLRQLKQFKHVAALSPERHPLPWQSCPPTLSARYRNAACAERHITIVLMLTIGNLSLGSTDLPDLI